jgi:glycosyltransferase involved in cell wall biosynthesis
VLLDQVRSHRSNALLCPNGVDYEHFARAREAGPPPEELKPILQLGRPIVGYYGALANWFDYELLISLAVARPDFSYVLIGPDYDGSLKRSPISHFPNIHYLGVQPYLRLPEYLRFFGVATIPFRLNRITHATSPLKLFEYMAGGKPVVITPMAESMQYEGVLVGEGAEGFSAMLDKALVLRSDDAYLELIDQVARDNTWGSRAELILRNLLNERQS